MTTKKHTPSDAPPPPPRTPKLGIPAGDRHDLAALERGDADVDLRKRVDAIEAELATFRRRLGIRKA